MLARPGPASQEGYPSSSPSLDAHSNDPFNPSQGRRYYDNESDHVEFGGRREYRETYTSDTSNPAGNDYDHNGTYDYRTPTIFLLLFFVLYLTSFVHILRQLSKIQTPILMFMLNVQLPHQSPSALLQAVA